MTDKPRRKRTTARARYNLNLHPDATARLDAVAPGLPAQGPGACASLIVMIGAAVVEARPDLVRAASDGCLTARDYGPERIGAAVGETVAVRLALPAPVALPEGWEIERIGHLLTLLAPGGAIIARIDSGGMHLWFTSYHSPTVLGAAIAAFVAAAGGAS